MSIFSSINFGENIAIDFGSSHISIQSSASSAVLREASCIAFNKFGKVIATGNEAADFEKIKPKTIKIIRPIQNGIITDSEPASILLAELLKKVKKNMFVKPKIMIALPFKLTDVEENAIINAVMRAGARQVITANAASCAALGAGCDISIARGLMVLDIGAEKSDVTAISSCRAVSGASIKLGGNSLNNDIKGFIRRRYNLEIGNDITEQLKKILSVSKNSIEKTDICGIDSTTKLTRKITIELSEADGIFDITLNQIADMIKNSLDSIPSGILGDIMEDGILLVGGGAKLKGLSERLTEISGIKLYPAQNIELCTINGAATAFENIKILPNIAQSYHNI